eukprot:Gregarina_sp_Poly_1__2744@NODE_175_length_12037_cov_139_596324_g155_i0_p15_GENE_NODE_175_length_12037_cov_139_596324_g155_i0NODE_175_length_12037_cov_139_596324_g155_i0_p15_ORF_typecomplete_len103_score6_33_NODE_175_length_12037_cov_139_596324_g155_i087989106
MTPKVIWMANLVHAQSTLLALIGVWSAFSLICPWAKMAKVLFYLSAIYTGLWIAVHIGIFYCHRKQLLLQCSPEYRVQESDVHFLFGQFQYPESFWYSYGAQ